jgi:hypothetical protein
MAGFSALPANASVVLGQIDDFQDGTVMNWSGGASPTNITTGGPSGAGDKYLQITSTGGFGPGGKLATYCDVQWSGDFTSAGVTSIDADVRNFGSTGNVQLRVLLFGSGGNFTSTVTTSVANDGLWHHITMGITAANLTAVDGANPLDVSLTLADVTRFMIRHQTGAPGGQGDGTPFAGKLGLDNIMAVPEPASLTLLALGVPLFFRRQR